MKFHTFIIASFFFFSLQAQMVIPVSYHKNVNLIFHSNIKDDNPSSDDFIYKFKNNIYTLGAATSFANDKSLTVITEDYKLYSFIIRYQADITQLNYIIPDSLGLDIPQTTQVKKSTIKTNMYGETYNVDLTDSLEIIAKNKSAIFSDIGYAYKKITVELTGIWVHNDQLYFKLIASNESNIDYDISSSNLYIKERTRLKKSTTKPIEKQPLYSPSLKQIPANSSQVVMVIAFKKFTIDHNKRLVFELVERNGGRLLEFEVKKDLIIQANKLIP